MSKTRTISRAELTHRQIIKLYGATDGKICKRCVMLQRFQQGSRWMKCGLTKNTGGPGSDWRAYWQACGKYEETTDGSHS